MGARGRTGERRAPVFRERVGVSLDEARRWDTPRLFRAPMWDQAFPADRMLPALEGTLDEEAAILRPATRDVEGRVTAAIDLADGTQIPLAAHDIGLLGRVERGEVVSLGGVRPALWAHWYGTDLRMTFESAAARDLA